MTIELHKNCQTALKDVLLEALALIQVENNHYLDFETALGLINGDEKLPKTGRLHDDLERYVGESPFFTFMHSQIYRIVSEVHEYQSDAERKSLALFDEFSNIESASEKLLGELCSLPWEYEVRYELPEVFGSPLRNAAPDFVLDSQTNLFAPSEASDRMFPLHSENSKRNDWLFGPPGLIALPTVRSWNKNTSYFSSNRKGFIPGTIQTEPVQAFIRQLKGFLGLAIAVRLVIPENNPVLQVVQPNRKSYFTVHQIKNEVPEIICTYEMRADISNFISSLNINDLDGKISENQMDDWISGRLIRMKTVFSNPEKSERIFRASQWLFDSYLGGNELLAFIQTTIAIEILLGKDSAKGEISLSELLSNRCAYLIGDTHSQRHDILSDFREIYRIRSEIVHRGKSKLRSTERVLFDKLRWICRRVIDEEITLIEKDIETNSHDVYNT